MIINENLLCADRISGFTFIEDPVRWRNAFYDKHMLEFVRHIGDVTGEEIYIECKGGRKTEWPISYKYWNIKRTIYQDYLGNEKFYINVDGCPAKLYDKGPNLHTLTAAEFTDELNDLANYICLPLESILIRPSEPSQTIYPGFNIDIQRRAVCYQGKAFKPRYKDGTGIFMGVYSKNAHYEIHLYFVHVKYDNLDQVAIRLERKYNRSQTFRRDTGINTWADLITESGIASLAETITTTWNDIIFFDPTLSANQKFSPAINEAIRRGNDPAYWKGQFKLLGTKKYKKLVNSYRATSIIHGDGMHQKILEMLLEKNKALIANKALTENENAFKMEDCYILLNGNNMPEASNDQKETNCLLINNKVRSCRSCNKDISVQRVGSIYCSKRCRNKINNLIHRTTIKQTEELINQALQAKPNRMQVMWQRMKLKENCLLINLYGNST